MILLNGGMLYKAQEKPYSLSVPGLPQRFLVEKEEYLVEEKTLIRDNAITKKVYKITFHILIVKIVELGIEESCA